MKRLLLVALVAVIFSGCNIGAGTLGSFNSRKFHFGKDDIISALDSLEEYKIPDKWIEKDNWSKRGYDFLESRIFYLQNEPEEMYYVTYRGNSKVMVMSIRAVFDKNHVRWLLEEDFFNAEKERIESRFDKEIIAKLEKITNSKAERED